ncbi:hypothetical protein COCSADRAFT_180132 [Bipolaris sorokiniana ND90Pr]|uniref:Thioesterase domain-containing protein n=1 Tax=Cochliobolus sativus (strain ND90Pr / ATCC 201652) TaxID=665912 RepID=M2T8Q5_COCSN|nr:uncharacterized protein COCSADRAFT_180132 [Bipolaris sorokiniana ND90Pr]EMD65347.1 hypothetical protein COCSADRAFT_180132 [Bipolaris sorokiniana ND90Pr]
MSDSEKKKGPRFGGDFSDSPTDKVKQWFDVINGFEYNGHDAIVAKILKLESVTYTPSSGNPHDARTVFSFVVPEELCNIGGNLHGGAVALVFDIATSLTILPCAREGFWDGGNVSRNRKCCIVFNCTYVRPAPVGSTIFVESWVVHLGKRMGLTMGTMKLDSKDGKVCYTCEHGKASLGGSNM